MIYDMDGVNGVVLDVLREIGNIGAGNAATALAKLLDQKVDMSVPQVKILEFEEVPELLGGPEQEVCGIFFRLEGELSGSIMFVLDIQSAFDILKLLLPLEGHEINELTTSALQEIGNILSGSYITSLSTLTGLDIQLSVPFISFDMAGAILAVPVIEFGLLGDRILIIENQFKEISEGRETKGFFFLVPDTDSYGTLLSSLGVNA